MKRKLKMILAEIEELFSDTSVSQEETLDALGEIEDSVQAKMTCLRNDMKDAEERSREV